MRKPSSLFCFQIIIGIAIVSLQSTAPLCNQLFAFAFPVRFRSNVALGFAIRQFHDQTQSKFSFRLLSISDSTEEDIAVSDEDLLRWEQMYGTGGKQADDEMASITRSEIRVVTFDLDNTLWNTTRCIDAANDALATRLERDGILQPKRVEKVMRELFLADKTKYCPLDHENAKDPVLLTQLRIDAIQHLLEEHNGYSSEDALTYAEEAFEVWTKARHSAIPNNFASSVLQCLNEVASIKTSYGHPVLIGAITDGNSDPRRVEALRDVFDFCINAEGIGVAKPDKRVYMEAVRYVAKHPSFQDLGVENMENEQELENSVGPYWVHVGDDFVKDVVAAKSLKMRSVWAIELIRDKVSSPSLTLMSPVDESKPSSTANNIKDSDSSEGKVKDFVQKIADKKVVEMSIGADSYLADSLQREFVDAITEEFHHLTHILLGWHQEGSLLHRTSKSQTTSESNDPFTGLPEASTTITQKTEPEDTNGKQVIVQEVKEIGGSRVSKPSTLAPRAFRLIRDECTMDVPAPSEGREKKTMKEVMAMAQMDKTSGVFAFPIEEVEALRAGKMVLMIRVGGTSLQFSRDIFVGMTVQDVLSLTDENPVILTLSMKEASIAPSFDLF